MCVRSTENTDMTLFLKHMMFFKFHVFENHVGILFKFFICLFVCFNKIDLSLEILI